MSLIRQDNEGAGPARNRGVTEAQGEWVYFLDSDDWIEPHAIESLLELGRSLGCEVVYCNMASNSYWPAGPITRFRRQQLTNRRWTGSNYLGPAIRARAFRYSPCTQILRRDFLVRHGISFPPQRIGQDVAFSVEVVLRAEAVAYHPEALFYRNLRPGSLTTGSGGVDTIRDALISHQTLLGMPSRVPIDRSAHAALDILTRRLWRHAQHQFDKLPKSLRDVLRGEHLAPDNPDLGREFIEQTRRGVVERALSRLVNRNPPPVPHLRAD